MNHFPVIKDLVVDMDPMFSKFRETLSFFEPKEKSTEPARIPPDAPEREEIRIATDCIACGCCVSSCTMVRSSRRLRRPGGAGAGVLAARRQPRRLARPAAGGGAAVDATSAARR